VARRKELLDSSRRTGERARRSPVAVLGGVSMTAEGTQRMPGAVSRWSAGKTLEWEPVRPELVVEVAYDAMEGDRFRHTARFVRWRPDREPSSCTYDQLERPLRFDVDRSLAARSWPRPRNLDAMLVLSAESSGSSRQCWRWRCIVAGCTLT
jgi:hypothetical protein